MVITSAISAAVFPMQMRGIEVIAVPTTLLSNRSGIPNHPGRESDAVLWWPICW